MKQTFLFFLLLSFSSLAKIPNMDIYFGGPLNNECNFVSNPDVIKALKVTIQTLNSIEERRNECQSMLVNSKAYLNTYVDFLDQESQTLMVVKANQSTIQNEINQQILAGTYTGGLDFELLQIQKDINKLENQDSLKNSSLTGTLQMGSTILEEMLTQPQCALSFGQHILSPTIGLLGNLAGYMTSGPVGAAAFGAGAKFLSSAVSYFSRIKEPSYRALRQLTESSNYYLSYKCGLQNIEGLICKLEKKEILTQELDLDKFAKKILELDPSGDFKQLRDLQRHRYRISNLIVRLEQIFNSPETFNDLKEIVTFRTRLGKLELEPKNPPLKNKYYIDAMKKAGLPVKVPTNPWAVWDKNLISWRLWYSRHIWQGDYFAERVSSYCKSLKNKDAGLYALVYNPTQRPACNPTQLQKAEKISKYIKYVIVPGLVDLSLELKRLNNKIRRNPNVQNLYAEVKSQEVNTGDEDYAEYTLSELLQLYNLHSEKFITSPARYFSKDVQGVVKALASLLDKTRNVDEFTEVAQQAYLDIAKISNNGLEGGILYTSFIESKISSYFDEVTKTYILGKDQKRALRFAIFSFKANLHRFYQRQMDRPDSEGSDDLAVMYDIRKSFLDVFGKTIAKKMKTEIKRYKNKKKGKRGLLHSCAIMSPFLGNSKGIPDLFSYRQKFCDNFITENEGIPYIINDELKYPPNPKNAPAFGDKCYYFNYKNEVITRKAHRYRKRSERTRF